jgi:hypothetical protein
MVALREQAGPGVTGTEKSRYSLVHEEGREAFCSRFLKNDGTTSSKR